MKRFAAFLTALALILTMLPGLPFAVLAVPAASGSCGASATWTLDDSGLLTISGSGAMTDYPNGASVPWFDRQSEVTGVVIEDGITHIGRVCFFFLENLTSVSIPNSVTSIADSAFSSCSKLTNISIPDGVTSIGKMAFDSCSALTSIVLPASLTYLGSNAFGYCEKLAAVTIPSGLDSIEKYAFNGCTSLKDVYYTGYDIQWDALRIGKGNECLTNAAVHFSAAGNSDHPYLGILRGLIDELGESRNKGFGTLYDIDGNGIAELILVHSAYKMSSDGFRIPQKVCSVYTMSEGSAVPLIENETLFIEAGGPSGYAAVVEQNGCNYLAVTSKNGEMDGSVEYRLHMSGSWKLYAVSGASALLKSTVSFAYVDADQMVYAESSASIDGQACSFEAYEEWESSLHPLVIVDPYDNEQALALEDLCAYIMENPPEDAVPSQAPSWDDWISQHMAYAASSEYEEEIIAGFSDRLLVVFRDACDDIGIKSFQMGNTISALLDLDVELSEADAYELILSELLYGNTSLSLTEEAYASNLKNTTDNTLQILMDIVKAARDAKELPGDVADGINDLYDVLQTLKFGSSEYKGAYSKLVNLIDGNVKGWEVKLSEDMAFLGMNIAFDAAFEQYEAAEDFLCYVNNYAASLSMSAQTRKVLEQLTAIAMFKYDDWYDNQALIEELGIVDAMINWSSFQTALESMITALVEYEESGIIAVAKYAVEREKQAMEQSTAEAQREIVIFMTEKIASYVPVLSTILSAKNIAELGLSASLILARIFTNVDEREYAMDIMVKTFHLSLLLDQTVSSCAAAMSEDDFFSTTVFDEAVSIYRRNLQLAVHFAADYATMVLSNAETALTELEKTIQDHERYGWTDKSEEQFFEEARQALIQEIRWYTNHIRALEEQRIRINSITCHDPALHYEPQTSALIRSYQAARIYVVACPVDVIVTNGQGEQIAHLSGAENEVAPGYEFYFRTIRTAEDPDDYLKVAIVPEDFRVELLGTAEGVMHAFAADFTAGDSGDVETYFHIPVRKGTAGHFEAASGGEDQQLILEKAVYTSMETVQDLPAPDSRPAPWIWIIGGAALLGLMALLFLRKKLRIS